MGRRILRLWILAVLITVPLMAQAQEQRGGDETIGLEDVGRGSLLFRTNTPGRFHPAPTQATEVEITVRGFVSEAIVRQRFHNPGNEWLEGVYVFPLPPKAAVHDMRLEIGETIIVGEIHERVAAKKAYQKAKRQGKKASLIEQERPNIFTTSVANIGPGEEVVVHIEYQQTLAFDSGRYELRFPMVVGPRYIPGPATARSGGTGRLPDTDQVPDASRITPPVLHPAQGKINPVKLTVRLDAGFPLDRLTCPSHAASISRTPTGMHRITLEDVPADRDFVLEWTPALGREPKAAVFTEKVGAEVFALAMVMPPSDAVLDTVRLPRETVFVIDTSGSMGGASIIQARDALNFALDQLQPEDYFNIIEFNSRHRALFRSGQPAMPAALEEARHWVNRLNADGGTEMMGALRTALADTLDQTPLRQIIFITDGCVGNEDALFSAIHKDLGRSRLFTIGIGSAPNSHFMERAASFGRGSFTHIGSPTEVTRRMQELFEKIENPVLADLELRWPDPAAETWPQRVPDLYAGEPVVVAARLAVSDGDLVVSGQRADRPWQVEVPLEIGEARAGVNRLWARRKIADLMDRGTRGVAENEIRSQVIEVALAHHLVSKYTSLVAVDVTPTRPEQVNLKTGAVPTNLPAGWQYSKVIGSLPKGGTSGRWHILTAVLALAAGLIVRRWF
ncbi:MAG: marine proteobacterial sortase target protein [bacterium]|nr:marine proteobacterial sortase target protein [bacterium]